MSSEEIVSIGTAGIKLAYERFGDLQAPPVLLVMSVLGSIIAGGRRQPIAEIELELKSGEPAALYDVAEQLALQLAEEFPIRLGAETKAARGTEAGAAKGYPLRFGTEPEE